MKTIIAKLSTLFATSALAIVGYADADTTSVQFGVGYRQDDINWKIKTPDAVTPIAKSELKFRDLEIFFLGAKLKANIGCSLFVRSSFDYGWILDGRVRESDRFYSDVSSTTFADGGVSEAAAFDQVTVHNHTRRNSSNVWDFDIALGYPIQCWCDEFQIAPMIGFNYDRQNIKAHEGTVLSDSDLDIPGVEAVAGSTASYRASWWGPWIGFDVAYVSCECWTLYGEFEFHFTRTRRERSSHSGFEYFDDYEHTKYGYGYKFKVGGNYIICDDWFVDASVAYTRYQSHTHRDDFDWRSGNIRIDLGYIF
jgi:hypothetical protein